MASSDGSRSILNRASATPHTISDRSHIRTLLEPSSGAHAHNHAHGTKRRRRSNDDHNHNKQHDDDDDDNDDDDDDPFLGRHIVQPLVGHVASLVNNGDNVHVPSTSSATKLPVSMIPPLVNTGSGSTGMPNGVDADGYISSIAPSLLCPLDWSIKTEFRLICNRSLSWCTHVRTHDERDALRHFLYTSALSTSASSGGDHNKDNNMNGVGNGSVTGAGSASVGGDEKLSQRQRQQHQLYARQLHTSLLQWTYPSESLTSIPNHPMSRYCWVVRLFLSSSTLLIKWSLNYVCVCVIAL
jgi:hypothetical protein